MLYEGFYEETMGILLLAFCLLYLTGIVRRRKVGHGEDTGY